MTSFTNFIYSLSLLLLFGIKESFKSLSISQTAFSLLVRQVKTLMPANGGHRNVTKMSLRCKNNTALKLEGFFPPLILAAHFVCSHMGDVLRVPAVFAGC